MKYVEVPTGTWSPFNRPVTSRRATFAAISLACILAGTALAHHGWSHYDSSKPLTLTGVIRESGYENPHGFVRLQADRGQGKTWLVVLAPPSRMQQRGLPSSALKAGATATVVGYPHRTESDEMRAERITIGDKTTELR